jgi:Lon protease-like protein
MDALLRDLPSVLPIFPLEGALLLPHGHLPLHIFEPRYRNMIDEALGQQRIVGMIQPRGSHAQPVPEDATLFPTGCAGRIVSFSETEDGRFLITLKGLCRFRVVEELPPRRGFRRVTPDFSCFREDFAELSDDGIDRASLVRSARTYLEQKGITCDWNAVDAAPASALVNTFAMTCPFEPREKQALLECSDLAARSGMLVSLFTMGVLEQDGAASTSQH